MFSQVLFPSEGLQSWTLMVIKEISDMYLLRTKESDSFSKKKAPISLLNKAILVRRRNNCCVWNTWMSSGPLYPCAYLSQSYLCSVFLNLENTLFSGGFCHQHSDKHFAACWLILEILSFLRSALWCSSFLFVYNFQKRCCWSLCALSVYSYNTFYCFGKDLWRTEISDLPKAAAYFVSISPADWTQSCVFSACVMFTLRTADMQILLCSDAFSRLCVHYKVIFEHFYCCFRAVGKHGFQALLLSSPMWNSKLVMQLQKWLTLSLNSNSW